MSLKDHTKESHQESAEQQGSGLPLIILNITLLGLVIGCVCMIGQIRKQTAYAELQNSTNTNASHTSLAHMDTSAFTSTQLTGLSAVVWDTTTHTILYAKNPDTPRPLASLTKIMMAVTARSILPESATILIKKDYLAEEGDNGLRVDEKWNFKNLLDFSLVVSSNDGARAIASAAGAFRMSPSPDSLVAVPDDAAARANFIRDMNTLAGHLGLSSMHFSDETGLDTATDNGGSGSARDMVRLMEYALKTYPDLFEATQKPVQTISSLSLPHLAVNTDTALSHIPNIIASKTGFTDAAGGNLIVAFDAGVSRPIIIAVLGSTPSGRFVDVEKLASSTLAFIRANP